jgi:hypothetical protein
MMAAQAVGIRPVSRRIMTPTHGVDAERRFMAPIQDVNSSPLIESTLRRAACHLPPQAA